MRVDVLEGLSLETLVEQCQTMVEVPPDSRDGVWAYDACRRSRLILREVEERWPPVQYVSDKILEAFMRDLPSQVEEVATAGRAGDWAKYMPHFAKNIRDRVAKLQEYVVHPPQLQD